MLEELCKRIQHCCASLRRSRNKRNVGSCRLKSLTGFKPCATTRSNIQQHATGCANGRNIVGQQLPTMLDVTCYVQERCYFFSFILKCMAQQCWKSCVNGSNIVALRFGDHGTKEMLGVVAWKVWPVSNLAQQHAATSNNMQQGVQTDATLLANNSQQCWMLHVTSKRGAIFLVLYWSAWPNNVGRAV